MTNYWKQFAESVTELKDNLWSDLVVQTRLRLMLLVVLPFLVTIGMVLHTWINYRQIESIEAAITSQFQSDQIIDSQEADFLYNLSQEQNLVLRIDLIIIFLSLTANIYLAHKALKPLKQLYQRQRRFMADASHELRTPLSVMKTESEIALLDEAELGKSEAMEVVKSNLEEVNRMNNILTNLLALSHFENTLAEMPFSQVDIYRAVSKTVKKMKTMAQEKNLTINLTKENTPLIWGNESAIEEMTLNLLKNAVAYTPAGGAITLSITNTSNPHPKVRLMVEDTGVGISQKEIPHIFEPFYKAGDMKRSAPGSYGLGLSIVKDIVARHNGTIRVKSDVGKGTQFAVIFPAC